MSEHHVEAYCTQPATLIRWGWECLTCCVASKADWDSPDAALAASDTHTHVQAHVISQARRGGTR